MFKKFALAIMVLLGGILLPLSAGSASAQTGGSLAGTTWILSNTSAGAAQGNPAPTLVFSNDGKISGNTICNSYGGEYTQSGTQIMVSGVVQTLRACVDQNLQNQEKFMLDVLKDKVNFTLGENKLTLTNAAGTLEFSFAPSSSGPAAPPSVPATGNGGVSQDQGFPYALLALPLLMLLSGALYLYSRRPARSSK